jgi:hypothetical protein
MDFPAGLDLLEADFDLFAKYIHPAFDVQRLMFVANQSGPQMINVYAMGGLKQGKTVAHLAPQRATVESGIAATTQPAAPPAATMPASQPAGSFATRP